MKIYMLPLWQWISKKSFDSIVHEYLREVLSFFNFSDYTLKIFDTMVK